MGCGKYTAVDTGSFQCGRLFLNALSKVLVSVIPAATRVTPALALSAVLLRWQPDPASEVTHLSLIPSPFSEAHSVAGSRGRRIR